MALTDGSAEPVLALSPVPGDVDIVIASELMEAGRAILRGFVTHERTVLIGSTHRVYAISEKSAMGDKRANSDRVLATARERAMRFIGFDMEAACHASGSVISSVMLGALAGSRVLPFSRETYIEAIRQSGISVESNVRGFEAGFAMAAGTGELPIAINIGAPAPTSPKGLKLAERVVSTLPAEAHEFALLSVQRLMEYQSASYASLYLDRLSKIYLADRTNKPFELTREIARCLGVWMAYEDSIRVADLKTRASRMRRVRDEVQIQPDGVVAVTEYLHPRLMEICDILPASIGGAILKRRWLSELLSPFFRSGRHVKTTSARWFFLLHVVSSLRPTRPGSYRYKIEQARIENWLQLVLQTN